jgi:hypothetical protein
MKAFYHSANTLFLAMSLAFFLNIFHTDELTDGDYCSPANLARAAESLRLGYNSEVFGDDLNQEASSESWKEHQAKLSGYASKLQDYSDAIRFQSRILIWAYVGSGVLMLSAILMNYRTNRISQED